MWIVCDSAAAFPMAARGFTAVTRPATKVKPAGAFIHALAMTTNTPEAAPLTATATPAPRWARGEIRSQP